MSKELVISSNHHETRVAILEDDQLVEIYFQRANEYSLAGSIHKGRVTRVLPGMQSAFVDLGLERDTFLYVSDFFEENGDEYDRITPEDRPSAVRRDPPRSEATRAHTAAPILAPAPVIMMTAPVHEIPEIPGPETLELAAESPQAEPRTGETRTSDDPDRRGRRSRRRRSRGRGFPESKYASDVTREERPAEPEPRYEAEAETREVILLPGESLAKYTSRPAASEPEFDLAELPEPSFSETVSSRGDLEDVDPIIELQSSDTLENEAFAAVDDSPVSVSAAGTSPDLLEDEEVFEPEELLDVDEIEAQLDTDEIEAQIEAAEALREPDTLSLAVEEDDEEDETEDLEVLVSEGTESVLSADPEEIAGAQLTVTPVLADLNDIVEEADVEIPAVASEDGGPAAAAGTASVRESGGRYPHRQSRRMRRKRGGDRGERPERSADRPESAVSAEPETRSPARPERPERTERPERSDRTERGSREERPPMPSISDLLREGQEIIVQIAKEPLGQKGARITSHIALPGRFVVYMPTLEHLGVSRKISTEEERQRLKRILQASRTGLSGGFIVRTAGEGRTEEEIAADMAYLYNLWLDIRQKAEKRKAPVLLHHDLDIVQRILRDQLSDMFKAIWLDNEDVYESVLRFMQRFQPSLVGRVKMYTRAAPMFDAFNVNSEIEKALRPKVWLKSGGYIVVNQTEALVAIDVNTGKFVGKSNRLEDTITRTNTEAVREIVRQIRLRDLGGIIVIDFIDMDERKNRQKVMQTLEEAMRADRAPYKILQFNDFGLVAITRKRVKQSLERTLCAPCPTCEGAGYTKNTSTVVGEIIQEATKVRKVVEGKNVELRVYPDVAKHLKSNQNSDLEEIEVILGCPVLVISDPALHPEKFDMAW